MRKWNTFGLFVLLLTVLTACNQAQNYGTGNKKCSGYSEGRNGCRRSGRSN